MDHVEELQAPLVEFEESYDMTDKTQDAYDQHDTDSVEQRSLHNDTSSSYPSESNDVQVDMSALYDQSSVTNEPDRQTDSVDNLLSILTEDNANSLPSGDAGTHFAVKRNDSSEEHEDSQRQPVVQFKREPDTDSDASSQSAAAVAEDLPNGDNGSQATKADVDAEMVSEDELPVIKQEKVADAEEVSDEELPGPRMAELPADTEVVSEDELPTTHKRKLDDGYDPGSPTESSEIPEKKSKQDEAGGVSDIDPAKIKEEKTTLPELEKYWKTVTDDPADFTGWTYLLQYVDQENDLEAARAAYDAFLSHYPYCYGYWRKFADYEKKKGHPDMCEKVFERGLRAIPLSVDLWIHYLTYVKQSHPDDADKIRQQFENAISSCGLEFRSDKLWEAYIKWETEAKRIQNVVAVYDRLLATPTQGYNGHFDSFQEVVNNHPVQSLVSADEFKRLLAEVRDYETPIKTEEPADHLEEEEVTAIKDKILAVRRKIHKATVAAVTARWTFEEGIKRPYFHVKPLERCQLKNWKEYLDFEIEQGNHERVRVLFERCLIACALYDDFWLKLIRYLESRNSPPEQMRDVYRRACSIHHPDKPSLHMLWASFEECHGNVDKAAAILTDMDKTSPNLLQIAYRRINLERRRGNWARCDQMYKEYMKKAKSANAGSLAIKWARFTHKHKGDLQGGVDILRTALERDVNNTRLALQLIDMALHRERVDEDEVLAVIDTFVENDGIELDQKVLFAQRKVEFLEDFGSSVQKLADAQRVLQSTMSKANEAKKKSELSPSKKASSKDAPSAYSSSSSQYGGQYGSSYYGATGAAAQPYGSAAAQPYSDGYGYNQQWQQYDSSGYGGYSQQWSGYGSSGYY